MTGEKAREVTRSPPHACVGEGSTESLIVVSKCVLTERGEAARVYLRDNSLFPSQFKRR